MPKVECVYNLRIDIVTKQKKVYQLKMLFSKLTNVSLFSLGTVSIHKLYTRRSYCIFYGSMKVGYERKSWQELLECLFHSNTGTLRQQSCLYPVPYRRQTVAPKRKSLQQENWVEPLQCTVKKHPRKSHQVFISQPTSVPRAIKSWQYVKFLTLPKYQYLLFVY